MYNVHTWWPSHKTCHLVPTYPLKYTVLHMMTHPTPQDTNTTNGVQVHSGSNKTLGVLYQPYGFNIWVDKHNF